MNYTVQSARPSSDERHDILLLMSLFVGHCLMDQASLHDIVRITFWHAVQNRAQLNAKIVLASQGYGAAQKDGQHNT